MRQPKLLILVAPLIAVLLQSSGLVTCLPAGSRLSGLGHFLPDFLDEKDRAPVFGDKVREVVSKRSVSQLERDRESELTAGGLIYETYENLPTELHSWLVEMDIVKTKLVERVLGGGEGSEPDTERTGQERGSRERKTAAVNTEFLSRYLWPDGRVPYTFGPFVSEIGREAAMRGINHWMSHTCLQFIPKKNTDRDYIQFVERDGCWSYVGRQGGVQLVSLGPTVDSYCKYTGVVLHELGHAIGLWHEQSRPDRDEYIEIKWENIQPGGYGSFHKYSRLKVGTFSLPYDYASIMHYPPYAFTRNGEQTIVPLNPQVRVMGQRKSLSPLDIRLANLLYNCPITNSTKDYSTDVSTSDLIPEGAFLLQNTRTHTCLDVSNRTTSWNVPMRDQHIYTGLYYVSLTPCRPESSDQYWKWTNDSSLLHIGTFLCLTALNRDFTDSEAPVTDLLVLMHCRGDDVRQKWACAGDFVENAHLGKCITAPLAQPNKRSTYTADNNRTDILDELTNELRQFMDKRHPSNFSVEESNLPENNNTTVCNYTSMVSLDYCELSDTRQVWCSIEQDNPSQLSHSICSSNSTVSHNLRPCYVKDMSATAGLHFITAEWTSCDQIGYYASGFFHTDQVTGYGATAVLSGIDCCASSSVFTGQADSPPAVHQEDCNEMEWWNWQDTLISEGWFSCPRGMFLKGFLLSTRDIGFGHYIWKVKCCKPQLSPVVYEHCYTDYGGRIATDTSVHRCRLEGYHVTGMYKRDCNRDSEECVEEITCCMSLSV